MQITIQELENLVQILLTKSQAAGFTEFVFKQENYWVIPSDDREKFTTDIPELCVGSLSEDLEGLKCVLNGSNPATPVDFDRLANVLIAIGESISRSKKIF